MPDGAFNAARPGAGYPDAPSAESIHQRFNARANHHLSWPGPSASLAPRAAIRQSLDFA